jgi:SAM-dependent methyltransferase
MAFEPDLSDPRFLDEIGWFLYHEAYERDMFGGSYDEERRAYSRALLDEVLKYCQRDSSWLTDKTVVSIGSGCTADLASWPADVKISIDPLVNAYRRLGMLLEDEPPTGRTIYLAVGAEDIPLIDETADLVICRNALDHMLNPGAALHEIARILKTDSLCYLDVDMGGSPTPDEPTVFTLDSLNALVEQSFEIVWRSDTGRPNSASRKGNSRLLLRKKKSSARETIDKGSVLRAYEESIA